MSATAAAFEPRLAPCGHRHGGEQFLTEDHAGSGHRGPALLLRVPEHPGRVPRRQLSTAWSSTTAGRCWRTRSGVVSDGGTGAAHDVLIVGGGGAGLRAAIAIAETDPRLDVAVVSKVYPMRSHTVSAEGGAAGGHRRRRQPRRALLRHGLGQRLARRPGRDRGVRPGGARGAAAARALGLPVEPAAGRPRRGPRLRRHEEDAHLVRRGQDRLPHAAHAVPDVAEVRRASRATTSGS